MQVEAEARISNPTGLHARPAVKLAQLAARFDADVQVRVGEQGDWIGARSTARVMKLKAGSGAVLQFRAAGNDARAALAALLDFVHRDFDEHPGPQSEDPAAVEEVPAWSANALTGEIASPGLALGRLYRLRPSALVPRAAGDPDAERQALRRALQTAAGQLESLRSHADATAADVIGFQVALLRDDAFLNPVFAAIGRGEPAHAAWRTCLENQIGDYRDDRQQTFRDRAVDLADVCERVLRALSPGGAGEPVEIARGSIVVAEELTPSQFLEIDWQRLAGCVAERGSVAGHVAILARARAVPMLVNVAHSATLTAGTTAILDARRGGLIVSPDAAALREYERLSELETKRDAEQASYLAHAARSADGVEIRTYLNVDDPALLDSVPVDHCDGIGLARTEFLFRQSAGLADEERQYAVYRDLVEWADGRSVTIRTLDAGGDKPVPGLTLADESNPFLGLRGIRLSLAREAVFREQLRALLRASAHGPLRIMLPMVALPEELERTRKLLGEEAAALRQAGIAAGTPQLGIMVEVPAAALTIESFDADFLSIGTNDLVQYTLAAGRDAPLAPGLRDPRHPAVIRLIASVVRHGTRAGIEVSVCGDMAATPAGLAALLRAGVRAVSVAPASLAATKACIARSNLGARS